MLPVEMSMFSRALNPNSSIGFPLTAGMTRWRRGGNPPVAATDRIAGWLDTVPLYRQPTAVPAGDRIPFHCRPRISKADIRRGFPHNFLPPDRELEELVEAQVVELEQTSGTSAEPTPLLLPVGWWDWQETQALRLNRRVAQALAEAAPARRVVLAPPVCNHAISYRYAPTQAQRTIGHSLYLTLSRHPFLWGEAELERMAAEAKGWQPAFLDLNPVFGVRFALHCEARGIRFPGLRFILSSYEYLSVVHRRILERVFQVPVFALYGATETGHLLMEDERGQLRPNTEVALLETRHPERQDVGELVVTTLTNEFMPLIRYSIGDLVAPPGTADSGYVLHGRLADAARSDAGQLVTVRELDECFAGVEGIAHYELRQIAGANWQLRYVPDLTPPSGADLELLALRLQFRLGNRPGFESVDSLMAGTSGKFRLVVPRILAE